MATIFLCSKKGIQLSNRKALVIAISEYDNLNNLSFCANDGLAVHKLLSSQNYHIPEHCKLIGRVESQVLRETIIDFFSDPSVAPDDTLLFYYSGHGVPDSDGDVYISTSQIDVHSPYRRGFSFYELAKMMRRSISKKIVAILDCCYSGSAGVSKGSQYDAAKLGNVAIVNGSNILTEGEGVCLLASSQAGEEAFALKEQNHSIFTYYLLEGLRGKGTAIDKYGYVTVDLLSNYIYNSIMSLKPERRPKQKPIAKMEISGGIVLAHYPHLSKDKSVTNPELQYQINDDLGKQYLEKGEYRRAIEYYDRATKDLDRAKLWLNKGIAYNKLRNNIQALKCFEIAQDLDPDNSETHELKGKILFNLGKNDEALICFEKSIQLGLSNENTWYGKGMCLFNLKKYDEALTCLDKSIKINPKAELALSAKGELLKSQGKYDEAQKFYDRAIEITPTLPVPWYYKGELLLLIAKYDQAIECFDRAIEFYDNYPISPGIGLVWNSKGNALTSLEKHDEAIICFDKALSHSPGNGTYLINKAYSLVSKRLFDDAMRLCDQVLHSNENNSALRANTIDLINYIGSYLSYLDRYQEGIKCFEKVLTIDSKNETATNLKKLAFENRSELKRFIIQNMDFANKNSDTSSSSKSRNEVYSSDGKVIRS